ncbi:MAPEG family protein [Rheinheimera sp.]|uniref:MAPEG family protein n=1 Tax=Rheinheimera sp. TaxID=1869214 RepID=UPI0027354E5B|nr:MAPEG family protein [Rheinheimera sp.]MDP2714364.1 MAPEG family protein [Rheinheimera sp.]
MITALYAALLGLMFIALSIKVIAKRRQFQIGIGSKGEMALQRAVRVHGNFAEYVPFALLLMFLAEYSGLAPLYLHILGIALLLGRLSHAWGVRQLKEPLKYRMVGMLLTFGVILLSALAILVLYFLRHTLA